MQKLFLHNLYKLYIFAFSIYKHVTIMAKRHYLPYRDAALDEWIEVYIKHLKQVGGELGISQDEIDLIEQLVITFKQSLDEAFSKKAEAMAAVGRKNTNKRAMLDVLLPQVQRMKNHPNYKESTGQLLRVIGAEPAIDKQKLKPKLKYKLDAGKPRIIWEKGVADAITIYVDRKDGKGFVFLTTDINPDYIDTHPVPDDKDAVVWKYKAAYIINDEKVGQESEEIAVTVTRTGETNY